MARWQCPAALIVLVLLIVHNSKISTAPCLDFVELFSGQGEVTSALRRVNGWSGSSHDLDTSGFMDMSSVAGFLHLGWV